jgi:AraC-like DNA-binding protein
MIAVLEGNVNVVLEGRSYTLKENQMIIIPPLCYHSILSDRVKAYKRITVLFDTEAIPSVLHCAFEERAADSIHVSYSSRVERLRKICKEQNASFYAPLAHSLMIQILYDTLRVTADDGDIEMDEFLRQVVSYIDRHLHEKIVLDDLARHTSRSKSSVCHLFEEKMNVSPKQYILQKKLALADKLIGEGTPPTVAAIQIGYDNYSNFYRIYKKYFGKSPNE